MRSCYFFEGVELWLIVIVSWRCFGDCSDARARLGCIENEWMDWTILITNVLYGGIEPPIVRVQWGVLKGL